jgi:hypothetical protein
MKLCYRGISYESDRTLKVTEGEIKGQYRGTPWRSRNIASQFIHKSNFSQLKYRGVAYQSNCKQEAN